MIYDYNEEVQEFALFLLSVRTYLQDANIVKQLLNLKYRKAVDF